MSGIEVERRRDRVIEFVRVKSLVLANNAEGPTRGKTGREIW